MGGLIRGWGKREIERKQKVHLQMKGVEEMWVALWWKSERGFLREASQFSRTMGAD